MSYTEGEVTKLQEQQRAAVSRAVRTGKGRQDSGGDAHLHPDLQDLNFGPLGAEQHGLPPPLRPSLPEGGEEESWDRRGSLSDFSDFESDDEGQIQRKGQDRVTVSDSDDERNTTHRASGSGHNQLVDVDDPFADPFAG